MAAVKKSGTSCKHRGPTKGFQPGALVWLSRMVHARNFKKGLVWARVVREGLDTPTYVVGPNPDFDTGGHWMVKEEEIFATESEAWQGLLEKCENAARLAEEKIVAAQQSAIKAKAKLDKLKEWMNSGSPTKSEE